MIISHLAGGLGNQLFQYAMGRQVAKRLGAELRLDLFSYKADRMRRYALAAFPIAGRLATWREIYSLCPFLAISRLLPGPLYHRAWRYLGRLGVHSQCRTRIAEAAEAPAPLPLRLGNIVSERQLTFDAEASQCADHSFLVGWWMHERYFSDIRPELLQEMTSSSPVSVLDAGLIQRMTREESVALHVRRSDKVGTAYYAATSLEYCLRAMEEMKRLLAQPRFYIFSDDPGWTRQHLASYENVTLVTHHDWQHAHEDLRLMLACRHQIIAASSLSWWAAWLNHSPERIVISPPAFHWNRYPGYDTSQLLPADWQVLDAPFD